MSEWVDISRIGSVYQEEMSTHLPRRYRHRKILRFDLGIPKRTWDICDTIHEEWKSGLAPDNQHTI